MAITTLRNDLGGRQGGCTIVCDGSLGDRCTASLHYPFADLAGDSADPPLPALTERAVELATEAGWRSSRAGEYCPGCVSKAPTDDEWLTSVD
ncbi:hypothetical protein [Peterkaempfera griseoplana]|uniref:hypothetical protein n=1 Tax=Peterkaempfera griseoplana TaxID=66896 RepID=UPI0006E39D49|nr:hypothetical protein [Peterkaempfera griseoplana]